ncbi:hypothetical protein [Magnetospirillum sp. 15-1]|uniref:hypothetical protein n=1 Tax=Magnetospirillum sp. 15-1 TaxID=1979370 RepID=UPI000BBCB0F3|nr:hypothetical protein [Magnetospirillum sp. 15-1]
MGKHIADTAIAANIDALAALLRDMATRMDEATGYVRDGQRNAAIGTIIDLDRMLADAVALHGAALALHRNTPA